MSKVGSRLISRQARDAIVVLGQLIRMARLERRMKAADLAERAGLSRGLLNRMEKGDQGCAIGSVFEVAAILGIPLFGAERQGLSSRIAAHQAVIALLPGAIRDASPATVDDDF